jgi:hypothetical protein
VGRAAFALQPVHTRLLEQLKQSTKLSMPFQFSSLVPK